MKRNIIAIAITAMLIFTFKGLLGLYHIKYLLFKYESTDANVVLYSLLNWILNIATIVGVFYIVRFVQMSDDVVYIERAKLRAKRIAPFLLYLLLFIIIALCVWSLVNYL